MTALLPGAAQPADHHCIAAAGKAGCTPGKALRAASWVSASSDGRNVYVGSVASNAVAAFGRDKRSGRLTQLRGTGACTSEGGRSGCARGRALHVARPIELSPDGRHAYVGTRDGVAVFARGRGGELRQLSGKRGCLTDAPVRGCRRGRALAMVRALAVSRDGRFVYAAVRGSDALAVFARSARSGALRQLRGRAGCVSERGGHGCARGRGLNGGRGVIVSRDQRWLYLAAEDGNSVAAFRRDRRTGRVRQLAGRLGCLQAKGEDGCAPLATISSPHHLLLGGGDHFAYVASDRIAAVVVLRRSARTGALSPVPGARGCLASLSRPPCRAARGLRGAHALAFGPGRRVLYVAGRNDNAVAVLQVDPVTGAPRQAAGSSGCFGAATVAGCAPANGLLGVHSVAASPDGRGVYAVSELDDALVSLSAATRARGSSPRERGASPRSRGARAP